MKHELQGKLIFRTLGISTCKHGVDSGGRSFVAERALRPLILCFEKKFFTDVFCAACSIGCTMI